MNICILRRWNNSCVLLENKGKLTTKAFMLIGSPWVVIQVQANNSPSTPSPSQMNSLRHNLSIRVQIDIDQPFGNGRGWIYRLGKWVRISPKIGVGPYLKEVAHRDKTKRPNWENSTSSMPNNLQLVALEASRLRSFSSSLVKFPFWDHRGYTSE